MNTTKVLIGVMISLLITLSFSSLEQAQAANQDELIYDDFNDGIMGTNIGGAAGPMSPDTDNDGAGEYDPETNFVSQSKEGGYALSINYEFPSGSWAGYWSYFNADKESGYDISNYNQLRLWAKGKTGNEQFKIELKSAEKETSIRYTSVASISYEEIVIPLSDFHGTGWQGYEPADLTSVTQVNIVFDRAPENSTVYIDQIRFTSGQTGPTNEAPTPDFDYSPSSPTTNDKIQFADQSTDSDGHITSWYWSFGDGSTSTKQDPKHQYSDNQTYTVTLEVTDNNDATSTTSQDITITAGTAEGGGVSENLLFWIIIGGIIGTVIIAGIILIKKGMPSSEDWEELEYQE